MSGPTMAEQRAMPLAEFVVWQRILAAREWPDDGLLVWAQNMMYTTRFCIGDRTGASDVYCFHNEADALVALAQYEPGGPVIDGWHRHLSPGKPTVRRKDGDPTKESVDGLDGVAPPRL